MTNDLDGRGADGQGADTPGTARQHLEAALDSVEDADGRFHIRQALQLLDVDRER